jgi:hypothetical protein
MYNPNRLEWHLGDRGESLNPAEYCVVLSDDKRTFDSPQSLVVALAKSQDHRTFCGVFAFGQRNAVRRWLRLRYPDTRADQIGERGLSLRARWLKQSGTVRGDDMAPKSNIEAQANFDFDHGKAVLCSNIHQRAIRNTDETVQMRWDDKRASTDKQQGGMDL